MRANEGIIWSGEADSRTLETSTRHLWSKSILIARITWGFLLAGLLMADSRSARGFSIESVAVEPKQGVGSGEPVTLKVSIATPMIQTGVYAPTTVNRRGGVVRVDIYPSSPRIGSPAIGSLVEVIDLGSFPIGSVNYVVEIHPDSNVGWGTRRVEGHFQVGMKLLAELGAGAIRLSWRGTGTKVRLERAGALGGSYDWATVTNTTTAADDIVTLALAVDRAGAFYRLVDGCLSNAAPTVSQRLSRGDKLANRRNPIVLLAEAKDEDGKIERVEFLVNGVPLAEDFEAPYSVSWTNAPSGVHNIQAVAWDDCGAAVTAKDFPVYTYDGQDVVECARTHLAGLLGELPTSYVLVSEEGMVWLNGCLGCLVRPICTQAIETGKILLFSGPGGDYEIHATDRGRLVLCDGVGMELGSCR